MTPDLAYLVLSALLCSFLPIPYVVGLVRSRGNGPEDYRNPPGPGDDPFLKRAYRAHMNMVENLVVFTVLVLVVHLTEQASRETALAAGVFFWSRLAHAIVYWQGWPYVRTLAFAVGSFANLYLAYVLLF